MSLEHAVHLGSVTSTTWVLPPKNGALLRPQQPPGPHQALALDADLAPLLHPVAAQPPKGVAALLGELDAAGAAGALHPGGDVDGVPEEAVG